MWDTFLNSIVDLLSRVFSYKRIDKLERVFLLNLFPFLRYSTSVVRYYTSVQIAKEESAVKSIYKYRAKVLLQYRKNLKLAIQKYRFRSTANLKLWRKSRLLASQESVTKFESTNNLISYIGRKKILRI